MMSRSLMVTFIVYAVGLRILWEIAKWNVRMLDKIYNPFFSALFIGASLIGWILLITFILRD